MPYLFKSPAGKPNFGVFWDEDTTPAPMKEGHFNKRSVILWNPTQPECGPIYHVVVNFERLAEKQVCKGQQCTYCKATRIYTKYLRNLREAEGRLTDG